MKEQIKSHFKGNHLHFYEKYLQSVSKIGGQEYQGLCCFHDDTKPSFSFSNNDGRYFCHGCGKKGDIFHFYSKINSLDTRRDFGKILRGIVDDFGISVTEQKARIVKTYDYTDEKGKPLFQVCRMEPKTFRQRHRNGSGKWIWNLKDVQRVLYNLPAVLMADEIFVVEGEKDADNLSRIGFTATTSPMGAKKWRDEYNESLKGKSVVLIPDNDNEGREHMTRVAQSLNGGAKNLKWLELPGLPSKGDVSDFLSKFDDPDDAGEELSKLIDQAKPYEPPKKRTIDDLVMPMGQFVELDIPIRANLLSPWLKENGIILISGWRGVGKTFFALAILDAISRGEDFGPWKCEKSVPVLFLDGEMSLDDDLQRINQLQLATERENPIYIYSDALSNQWGLPRANLSSEKWRSTMKRILITKKIKCWVIDNLASLASGIDENKKQDWDVINQFLLELRFSGISTAMLHHVGKEGQQRGTSAREDNLDGSILLKPPPDYVPEDGCRFICHFSKARVATSDISKIADTEFKLIEDQGHHVWTWGSVKAETRREVLKLLDEGLTQISIAENLGITRGRVSQIVKRAKKDGYLSSKGKLTQSGFLLLKD